MHLAGRQNGPMHGQSWSSVYSRLCNVHNFTHCTHRSNGHRPGERGIARFPLNFPFPPGTEQVFPYLP